MGCVGTPVAVGRWAEGGGRGPRPLIVSNFTGRVVIIVGERMY